jgi:hypothetical protein
MERDLWVHRVNLSIEISADEELVLVGEGFIVENLAELAPCGTCQPAVKPVEQRPVGMCPELVEGHALRASTGAVLSLSKGSARIIQLYPRPRRPRSNTATAEPL